MTQRSSTTDKNRKTSICKESLVTISRTVSSAASLITWKLPKFNVTQLQSNTQERSELSVLLEAEHCILKSSITPNHRYYFLFIPGSQLTSKLENREEPILHDSSIAHKAVDRVVEIPSCSTVFSSLRWTDVSDPNSRACTTMLYM